MQLYQKHKRNKSYKLFADRVIIRLDPATPQLHWPIKAKRRKQIEITGDAIEEKDQRKKMGAD